MNDRFSITTGLVKFTYCPDLTGSVLIQCQGRSVEFPIQEMLDFVADLVVRKRIEKFEDLSTEEVLGL